MSARFALLGLAALALACSESYVIARTRQPDAGSVCEPELTREARCADGVDDDCDGYVDCLDPDCEAQRCGDGRSCRAGACLACTEGELCAVPLAVFDDIRVDVRGDTAVVQFAPVKDALDYRIYLMPEPAALGTDTEGRPTVRDAIYRCAGRRTVDDREEQYGALYAESLRGRDNGYVRSEAESVLGHVYARAGEGRVPVFRLADPSGNGGYFNAEWIPPLYREANSAEYVIDPARRAELVRQGFRNDGIAFYAPLQGKRSVYRAAYEPDAHQGARVSLWFTEGPEHDARTRGDQSLLLELGERFQVLAEPASDTVPLYRVTYRSGSTFDVLAAGEAAYQRVLHQGGPVTSLTWSGLRARSVLVIEALDAGCPFPRAYLGAFHVDAEQDSAGAPLGYPTETLDTLRAPETGEVYVNGQHDPESRPRPIARSFVEVAPEPPAAFDFHARFDDPGEFEDMQLYQDSLATVYRNARWSIEASACEGNFSFGAVLGQLFLGMGRCRVSVVPRGFSAHISAERYLHVRMASDLPSTGRRYPQLLITSARSPEADEVESAADLPIHNRLGPLDRAALPGPDSSIIIQPYFSFHELQLQFCGRRGWGPTVRCPRANIYGYNAGESSMPWVGEPWLPVPVVTDRVGFDRPVWLDVYASTERVYVFLDGQPAGCAVLPPGQMPAGEVSVALRALLDEPEKDDVVRLEPGRVFERSYSQLHSDRRMDDLGIALDVPAPAWDDTLLPCGTRWFGGQLIEP
jgi:hypothetical protein